MTGHGNNPTDADLYAALHAVFDEARKLTGGAREAFLRERCAGDDAMLDQVMALLDAATHDDESDDGFSETRIAASRAAMERLLDDSPPREVLPDIPGYTILRRIGAGGMGVVYEAEQLSPHRRVALKLLNPHLITPERRRRFAREIELLARLTHPGIARLYEASETDPPYFGMELVEGEPIDRYAARAGLGTRDRLELLARVCDGVDHAHNLGIIHRDLKPANVLVTRDGQPKILDFGIGRATDSPEGRTMMTETGVVVGTLEYMSPEQISGRVDAIDARTDVYALGVMLYELLTGVRPFELSNMTLPAAARLVTETEARRVGTTDRRFRGDVETIIAKALALDPKRRYEHAGRLADDLRRHLEHRPITARKPSAAYRAHRFAARNKILTASAVIIVALTAVAFGVVLRERDRAIIEARTAERVTEFLEGIFEAADPNQLGSEATLAEAVALGERRLAEELGDEPMVEARLRETLGRTLRMLGEPERSLANYERAAELFERETGRTSDDTLRATRRVGVLLRVNGRYRESIDTLTDVYERQRSRYGNGSHNGLLTLNSIALVHWRLGELDRAAELLDRVIEGRERLGPRAEGNLVELRTAIHNLGLVRFDQGRCENALALFRKSQEIPDDLMTNILCDEMIGNSLMCLERHEEAREVLEQLWRVCTERLTADHPKRLEVGLALGRCLMKLGEDGDARWRVSEVANLAAGNEQLLYLQQQAAELLDDLP